MTDSRGPWKFAALLLLTLGCGRSPAPNYYLLQGVTSPARESRPSGTVIALSRVRVPEYLDRNSLIFRKGDGTSLEMSPDHRWAEPLNEAIRRVLRDELAVLRPDITFALPEVRKAPHQLVVEIRRLEMSPGANCELLLDWQTGDGTAREFSDVQPIDGSDPAAAVHCVSKLLGRAAGSIAGQL